VKVVVGLGNPGSKYAETRHNVGWMVLDRLADRAGIGGRGRERDAAVSVRGRIADHDLVLVKPLTFMNDSGIAVRKILARERTQLADMLVVVDDFALPLGRMRIRSEGTHGGHNGLRSIAAELGTQRFARLRVGIGEPGRDAIDHVLSRFAADERGRLDLVLDAAADAVETWIAEGTDRAANLWNGWHADGTGATADAAPPTRAGDRDGLAATPGAPGHGRPGAAPAPSTDAHGRDPAGPERPRTAAPDREGVGDAARPPGPGEVNGPPGPDGVRRTRTGWRRILRGQPGDDR
jgi:PTH1 family peptidyl-tRNA hydrolase